MSEAPDPEEDKPPPVDDPKRMEISEDEFDMALTIKERIHRDAELENRSDFWCVQLGLGDHDAASAVERAKKLQAFREEYGILDTLADGRRFLHGLVGLFPTLVLGFEFAKSKGYYCAMNMKGVKHKEINTPEKWRTFLGGLYYLWSCFGADFDATRRGVWMAWECADYDWTQHISLKLARRLHTELWLHYPVEFQMMAHYNTGLFVNLLFSMMRRIVPERWLLKVRFGCQAPGGHTLEELHLQPTVEEANQRTLMHLEDALERRYQNEANWTLDQAKAALSRE